MLFFNTKIIMTGMTQKFPDLQYLRNYKAYIEFGIEEVSTELFI